MLKPITETCTPRADVLTGGLTDEHFAAQLDKVVRNPEQYPIYGDPTEFFAITYPTSGLRSLLTSTFGRLSQRRDVEGSEHGVVRFETSFGGGKTHGLIAAYHLATGARPIGLEEFIDPDLLPEGAQIAAVVGDGLDPVAGTETNGHRPITMWGAIGAQLGDSAWELVGDQDAKRTAPGKETWIEIFSRAPTLVIIDEVANHLRALRTSGDPDIRRQAEAMPSFLFNLFAAAASVPTARVIITLASENDAFSAETKEVQQVLEGQTGIGSDVGAVIARYREVLVPAADEEISEILRRRLFERINEPSAYLAGEEFQKYYAALDDREVRLGLPANIASQVTKAYPLHPELVKVLDTRIGTIPAFQRTRGALRLLAETVATLWANNSKVPIINLGDLPLATPAVASSVTRAIGREAFSQVIEADVAGRDSHAAGIDRSRFPGGPSYTQRSAAAVLLHSLESSFNTGATLVDVWRATLTPGEEPDLVQESLSLLDASAWHFVYDGARYRFQTEPNPRKIIEDETQGVLPSMVREELDRRIQAMFTNSNPIRTRIFPGGPEELDDLMELQLAVISYEDLSVRSTTATPTHDLLVTMLDTHGVAGSNRTYRNGVVFLVADTDQIEEMRSRVRYDLAAQRIVSDPQRMASFVEDVQKKLRSIADRAQLDARVSITRCYRHLYYPKNDRANHHLRHHELSQHQLGTQDKQQTAVIRQVLEQVGKIRSSAIATEFLAQIGGFPARDPISTEALWEAFWRNHDADLVINPNLITDSIAAGVRSGFWVYYDSDSERTYGSEGPPPAARIAGTAWLYTPERAAQEGLLGRNVTWPDVQQALAGLGGQLTGIDLRARLEQSLGKEPTKTSVMEVLARVAKQSDSPIAVIEGEPAAGRKALTSSQIERSSLDRVTVLSREKADDLGIVIGAPKTGFRLTAEGPVGQAVARIRDQLSELGAEKKVSHISISHTSTSPPLSEARTLLTLDTMMPKHHFTSTLFGSVGFENTAGSIEFKTLTGQAKDIRKVEKLILDLADKASEAFLIITLTHRPDPPADTSSAHIGELLSLLTDLRPGQVSLEVLGE